MKHGTSSDGAKACTRYLLGLESQDREMQEALGETAIFVLSGDESEERLNLKFAPVLSQIAISEHLEAQMNAWGWSLYTVPPGTRISSRKPWRSCDFCTILRRV